ncbi:hypothetical protein PAHAL_2G276300 [Panicum hallii]|nr:hypothetical protein PAHAL_2G276300 [Panicum hallii]
MLTDFFILLSNSYFLYILYFLLAKLILGNIYHNASFHERLLMATCHHNSFFYPLFFRLWMCQGCSKGVTPKFSLATLVPGTFCLTMFKLMLIHHFLYGYNMSTCTSRCKRQMMLLDQKPRNWCMHYQMVVFCTLKMLDSTRRTRRTTRTLQISLPPTPILLN